MSNIRLELSWVLLYTAPLTPYRAGTQIRWHSQTCEVDSGRSNKEIERIKRDKYHTSNKKYIGLHPLGRNNSFKNTCKFKYYNN